MKDDDSGDEDYSGGGELFESDSMEYFSSGEDSSSGGDPPSGGEELQEFYSGVVRQVVASMTPLHWISNKDNSEPEDDKALVPKFNNDNIRYFFFFKIVILN